ncbi:hypothetical protein EJB05_23523, partial [Eragrostis curvula]
MAAASSAVKFLGTAEELDTATSLCFKGGGADLWTAAEKTRSTLTSEVDLRRKCANYNLPAEYTVLCANDWPPCRAPEEGSNTVCIYESMLEAGIRFPLHEFYTRILRHCNLAPSQLCPNAWRYLAGFVLLCKNAKVEPTKACFRYFFKLCAHGGEQQGWYYFVPYSKKRVLFKSVGSSLPSNDGWKKRFFFIDLGSADQPWWCPKKWGTPSDTAYGKKVKPTDDKREAISKKVKLTDDTREAISKLEEEAKKYFGLNGLLCESQNQHNLSALPPPVKQEATSAGSDEFRSSPATRKRKSLRDILATPPQEMVVIPGTSSPPDRKLSSTRLVYQLMQKTEKDLSQTKELLREVSEEHAVEVAHIKEELGAAKAEHAAEVAHLQKELGAAITKHTEELEAEKAKHMDKISSFTEELQAAKATNTEALKVLKAELTEQLQALKDECATAIEAVEADRAAKVSQLTERLQAAEAEAGKLKELLVAEKAQRAEEVTAIKIEYQNRVTNAEHMSNELISEMLERYAAGLREILCYPREVDATQQTPEALGRSVPQAFQHPHQAPADQGPIDMNACILSPPASSDVFSSWAMDDHALLVHKFMTVVGLQSSGMTSLATSCLPDSLVRRMEKGPLSGLLGSILQMAPQDSLIGIHSCVSFSMRSICTMSPSFATNFTSSAR